MSKARNEIVPVRHAAVKLRNRRVAGGLMADGTISFKFRRLGHDRTIVRREIRVSMEALMAMVRIAHKLTTPARAEGGEQ